MRIYFTLLAKLYLFKKIHLLIYQNKRFVFFQNTMATLEDKILGEKKEYYCSSSEDEDQDNYNDDNQLPNLNSSRKESYSINTGPKGVIEDQRRYKELESEQNKAQEKIKLEIMEKLSIRCKSFNQEQVEKNSNEDELDENDPFIEQFIKKRMKEMMQKIRLNKSRNFGKLNFLKDGNDLLDAIENEHKGVLIICHIYNQSIESCTTMNHCLDILASQYAYIKFCAVEAYSAGLSERFEKRGVPALLIYKNGNLVGNFIRTSDDFGDDFYATDVEAFLIEQGFLPNDNLIPEIIKNQNSTDD